MPYPHDPRAEIALKTVYCSSQVILKVIFFIFLYQNSILDIYLSWMIFFDILISHSASFQNAIAFIFHMLLIRNLLMEKFKKKLLSVLFHARAQMDA